MYLRRLCATAIVLITPLASASTLNSLDADPIIAIHGNQAGPKSELGQALGKLDWMGMRRTVAHLLRETTRDVPDEVIQYLESGEVSLDDLAPACQPAVDALLSTTDYALGIYGPENSFFPRFKLQIKPENMPAQAELDSALKECFMLEPFAGDTLVFNQGPMPIYVHRDDSVIQIDSSSTWNKAASAEFAAQIGQAFPDRQATEQNFLLSIDFEAITQLAQPFVMMSGELDPAVVALLSETLSTLGDITLTSYYDGDVLNYEMLNTPAPGYSAELYDLMTCKTCKSPKPLNVSSRASLSSFHNNMPVLADWLVKRLGEAFPEGPASAEVAPIVKTLFGWMGEDMHMVMQDASYTIPNLLKSNMAIVFDTTGPEQRAEAVALVSDFAQPAIESLSQFSMDDLTDFTMIHTDSRSYRNVEINRIRMGPSLDLVTAVVNEQAIISTNPMGIRSLIDDLLDGGTPPVRYTDLIAEAEENNGTAVGWGNVAPQLRDMAAMLDVANQFGSSIVAAEFADYRPLSRSTTEREVPWEDAINPTATVSPRGTVNQIIQPSETAISMQDFEFVATESGNVDLSVYSNDIYLNTAVHETGADNKVTGSFSNIERDTQQTIFTIPVQAGRLYIVDVSTDTTTPGDYEYQVALSTSSSTSEPIAFAPPQTLAESLFQGELFMNDPTGSVLTVTDGRQAAQISLADLAPNTRYTLEATASDDLELSLVDRDRAEMIHYNDDRDNDDLNPAISFTTPATTQNLVAVVRAVENTNREVTFDLSLQPAADVEQSAPVVLDFKTLLEAGDVLVDAVDLMADYLGESYSATFVEEKAVRTKGGIEIR